MDFSKEVYEATKYLNENTQDPKVKKATDLMLSHYNSPKKDYSGVTNFINGNKEINNSKLGEIKTNDVLTNLFNDKNAIKQKELNDKKATEENTKIENERLQKENEETSKADKLKKRKMHQQALVSSRVTSGNSQKPSGMSSNPMAQMLGM